MKLITVYTQRWFELFFRAHESQVLRRIVGITCLMGIYASGVVKLVGMGYLPHVNIAPQFFSVSGILLSLVLTFRNNSSFDRWWEARKLWGGLVNCSRNVAILFDSLLPKDDLATRRAVAVDLAAYASATSDRFRGQSPFDRLQDYDEPVLAELRRAEHVPNAIARRVAGRAYELHRLGRVGDPVLITLMPSITAMTDMLGGCERIKTTPLPGSYESYVKNLLIFFCGVLPFALEKDLGFLAIPATMVAFGALGGLEVVANDIEDPFGMDQNDLPTPRYAETIRRNVFEILLPAPAPATDPAPAGDRPRVHGLGAG